MNISIIVTSYNRRPLFYKSFNSFKRHLTDNDEIIVVEEGRDENWQGFLRSIWPNFQFYFTNNKKYRSCSFAKNIALKKAKNELIMINDPEVEHLTDIIPEMKKRLFDNPRQFIVPSTLYSETRPNSDRRFWAKIENQQAPFVAMCMKNELISVGGWDERFKYWGNDDNDLMYRLGLNGCSHVVMPGAEILHQWHERPPMYAMGDYNEPILYEKSKNIVANTGREWGEFR